MHVMHFYSFKYEKREDSPLGIGTVILMMIVESSSCVTELDWMRVVDQREGSARECFTIPEDEEGCREGARSTQ